MLLLRCHLLICSEVSVNKSIITVNCPSLMKRRKLTLNPDVSSNKIAMAHYSIHHTLFNFFSFFSCAHHHHHHILLIITNRQTPMWNVGPGLAHK